MQGTEDWGFELLFRQQFSKYTYALRKAAELVSVCVCALCEYVSCVCVCPV